MSGNRVSTMFIVDMIEKAIDLNASDIHISEGKRVVMRVDGKLVEITTLDTWNKNHIYAFLEVAKVLDIYKDSQRVNSSFTAHGKRFRLHGYSSFSGINLALRVIPLDIPKFEDLNLPEQVRELVKQRSGLILVTGPTGSGKSTTLASLIELVNNDSAESNMIITVENPIEFLYEDKNARVVQREVGKNVESFEDAIKDAMREDPDIILIGELQDRETIRDAITLAETGHLVLGSLHSNGAADSFTRIVDAFPGDQQEQVRAQLANRVLGVLHQRLIPAIGDKGRVPLVELLMLLDSDLRRIVRNDSSIQTLEKLMIEKFSQGLLSKERSAVELLSQGKIDVDTAMKYSNQSKADINKLLNVMTR